MKLKQKTIYLHVGIHKTATSTIQSTLSLNRAKLTEHGYCYSILTNKSINNLFKKDPEKILVNFKAKRGKNDIEKLNKKKIEQVKAEIAANNCDNYIFSGECISKFDMDEIKKIESFLLDLIPNGRIVIVIGVRHYISQSKSGIQEMIKGRLWGDKALRKKLNSKNMFKRKIAKFIETFGKDNIIAYKFEDSIAFPYGPAGYFLELIGFNTQIIPDLEFVNKNMGVQRNALEIISFINREIPYEVNGKLSKYRCLNDVKPLFKISGGGKYLIPDKYIKQYIEKAKDEHRWLRDNLDIDYTAESYTQKETKALVYDTKYCTEVLDSLDKSNDFIKVMVFKFAENKLRNDKEEIFSDIIEQLKIKYPNINFPKEWEKIRSYYIKSFLWKHIKKYKFRKQKRS